MKTKTESSNWSCTTPCLSLHCTLFNLIIYKKLVILWFSLTVTFRNKSWSHISICVSHINTHILSTLGDNKTLMIYLFEEISLPLFLSSAHFLTISKNTNPRWQGLTGTPSCLHIWVHECVRKSLPGWKFAMETHLWTNRRKLVHMTREEKSRLEMWTTKMP